MSWFTIFVHLKGRKKEWPRKGLYFVFFPKYLIPLNEKKIVKCINDEVTKPRYYTLTKAGKEIIDNL